MKKIDGIKFKSMLISAGNNLYNHYPEIDSLNVFPVPDGDTGTNMNLTFTSGVKEIANMHNDNIGDIAKSFSRGLLMGARGNSGVILSQIFKGISNELEGKDSVDSVGLAKALVKGKIIAYKAVMRPVEGTILTVIRESSDSLIEAVKRSNTINETLELLIGFAQVSLDNTPELLPVLKEVGVVDSGGYGLVKIFEGMQAYVLDSPIEKKDLSLETFNIVSDVYVDNHDGQYGYCTEFIIKLDEEKEGYSEVGLKDFLESIGDSIVVVDDEDIVKVHVHTLDPGQALSQAVAFGDLINIKIENMQEQAITNEENKIREQKEVAIIAVSSGSGLDKMFKELRVDLIVGGGQTMNPSTQDFIEAVEKVNAKNVFILPNNSNIILAAQQAAEVIEGVNVVVVPSKTLMQGMSACLNYNPDIPFTDNATNMNEGIGSIKSGEVTFAVKDTTFDGRKIKKNDFMAIAEKTVVENGRDKVKVTKTLIDKMIDADSELVTLVYGEDVKKNELNKLVSFIEENYDVELELVMGKQKLYSFYIGVE